MPENFIVYLSLGVEAHNLLRYTASSAWLYLVTMSKQIKTGSASAVIQLSVCQYTDKSTLTTFNVTKYCYPQIQKLQQTTKRHNYQEKNLQTFKLISYL